MYMFTRRAKLAPGNIAASMNWALQVTEKVNQITELEVNLWMPVFSPAITTLSWTALVEDLSLLEASDAKLNADTGFQLLVDEGTRFMTSEAIDDGLAQYITPMQKQPPEARPNYATVVTATLAPGGFTKGIEVGLKIAEQAAKVTGMPTSFLSSVTGRYGEVRWVGVCDTIEQLQAAQQAIAADATLLDIIDREGSKVYQPTAHQLCYRRVA